MPRKATVYQHPLNVDLPVELVQELDDYVTRTGMKKKECVELALLDFLKKNNKPQQRAGRL